MIFKGKYEIHTDKPEETGDVYNWFLFSKSHTQPIKCGQADTLDKAETDAKSAALSFRHNLVYTYLINRNKKGINCNKCKTPDVKEIDYVYECGKVYCDTYTYYDVNPIRSRIINGKCYDSNEDAFYLD